MTDTNAGRPTEAIDRAQGLRRLGFAALFFCAFLFAVVFYGGLAWAAVRLVKAAAALLSA